MPWIIDKIKDLLPNRPFGKTAKDNRVARLIDLEYVVSSANEVFSQIETAINAIPGSPVPYSNVCFVDRVNGNDGTGVINILDRPFLTISAARTAAAALTGISSTNRALVYIRRGEYSNPILTLTNNVDFYCEPGVVFTGTPLIRDNGVAVNSSVYGSLRINSGGSTMPLVLTGASTVTFEFDSIISNAAAFELNIASASNRITITGNYVYSNTLGQGFGCTVRGATNAVVTVRNAFEAIHSVIRTRFFTGNLTFNCPNIRLVAGNIYGGNLKDVLYISDSSSTGNITINGDLINSDPVFYGGVGTALKYRDGIPNNKVRINGNIIGGVTKGTDAQIGANAELQITGNVSSNNSYAVWAYGSGKFLFKNSVIRATNAAHTASAIAVNGTAEVFFKDCYMLNLATDQAVIEINSATSKLVLDGCQGRASGTGVGSLSITTTVGGGLLYVNNSRFNKIINAALTDQYVPSGLIIDPNTQVPNIF